MAKLITAIGVLLAIGIVCFTWITSQEAHYAFIEKGRAADNHLVVLDQLEAELKTLHELKAKVDTLVIRSGLKKL